MDVSSPQIVSSFSANLFVPWPSIYFALANALSVVSLQFLKLPDVACVQPDISFFTVFLGVDIATLLFIVFCIGVYMGGQRMEILRNDVERRRRFKSRVLSTLVWGLFLIYPQVASTTLLIFSCSELENGTQWLQADYRIQCWTPKHKLHVGIGAFFTLLFPFGIPATLMFTLHRARIPELATWKRDCAWMRSIVQRSIVLGLKLPEGCDPDTLTTESITIEHLQALQRLFIAGEENVSVEAIMLSKADESTSRKPTSRMRNSHFELPRLTDGSVVGEPPHPSTRSSQRTKRSRAASSEQPQTRWGRLWHDLTAATKTRAKTMRRSLSTLFYRNEREHLLVLLLDFAKNDKTTLIHEPRDNQLRWRTGEEWKTLTAEGVRLGKRDATELAAFRKFSFVFAEYGVRAWWWESVDLLQKLFFTSILAFIAPRTSVQVIVATMAAFAVVLLVTQVKPYRDASNNQLAALSQVKYVARDVARACMLHASRQAK